MSELDEAKLPRRVIQRGAAPLVLAGLLLWLGVVLAAYYAGHKPLSPTLADAGPIWGMLNRPWSPAALLDSLMSLGAAAWLIAISFGLGCLLLRAFLGGLPARLLEQLGFGTALGLVALALAVFGLGVTGGLRPLQGFFALGLLSGVALIGLRGVAWRQAVALRSLRHHAAGGLDTRLIQLLLFISALLLLSRALTPPTAWDSLVYHLTGPLHYLAAQRIVGGLDIPHVYFPALVQQLFTAALLIQGDVAARLMHLLLAGLGALSVYAFLARREGPRAAWVGVALLASAGSLLTLATQAYVEWGLLTFAFLAFWALQEALDRYNPRWLLVSGCLAGAALGVKYTGLFLVAALAGLLIWRAARRFTGGYRRPFPTWNHVALWCGVSAAVAAPWYLRSLALTGNPVYPFFVEGWLEGWRWDAWKADWFIRPGTGLLTEPGRLLAAPWELTVLGIEDGAVYDVIFGPLFLALLPLLLVVRPRSAWAGGALLVTLVGYLGWLYGAAQSQLLQQGRLLLPVLPFLAVLLSVSLNQAWRLALPALSIQRLLRVAVALVLLLGTVRLASDWAADPPLPYIFGAEGRPGYLERHLGDHYRAMQFVNRLGPEAKTLALWEPRTYYCQGQCQADALLYNWRYLLHRHSTPEAIYQALRAEGYTHLLLYGGGLRFFSEPPNVAVNSKHVLALARLEAGHLELLYGPRLAQVLQTPLDAIAGGGYAVYRLTPERP